MKSGILILCVFLSGCLNTTREGTSEEMMVREETRRGTEAGQKTDLKIVTREVSQKDAKEVTKTEVDVDAIVQKATNAMMAVVSTALGDYKAGMDRFMSAMSAPKPAMPTGLDGTTLGGFITAGVTLTGVAVQKHLSSTKKSKELQEKNAQLVELAKKLPPEKV